MPRVDDSTDCGRWAAIPAELKALRRWVCWREVPAQNGGKPRKLPICPKTGKAASSTNPEEWATFDEACSALSTGNHAGLMFALHPDDGFVFIDLDDCRNPRNKGIRKWAEEILGRLNSYSEVSPSGTGVHVLVKAKKPGERCRQGQVEIYDRDRFATMTGRRLERCSPNVEARQAELEAVYQRHLAISQSGTDCAVPSVPVPPEKLAQLLRNKKAAAIYRAECNGEYPSQSEADLALMNIAVRADFSEEECRTLIDAARKNAGAEPKHDGYYRLTYQKARGDVSPMTMEEARSVFKQWFELPDTTILDVTLAVVASSHLPGDPIWIHAVAPPSSGKTEIITAVSDWPTVYALTEFTPAGLVSGRDSEDGQDHSLLPKLHGKTLCIKDFTPTIDAPKEQRQKLFGRLRDVFDGAQAIHTAMVGTRAHKGTFNCITGVTNAIEKVWRNTSLGERYLLYRHPVGDPLKSAALALESAPVKGEVRAALRQAACGVLAGVDHDCVPQLASGPSGYALSRSLINLSAMLAKARTFVERTRDHKVVVLPESEGPARIAQQLFKLGQGLALINRRAVITAADLVILKRVAVDSMPMERRRILAVLAGSPAGRGVPTKTFEQRLGLSQSAVHEQLEDLCLLGICLKRKANSKANPIAAAMQQNCYELAPQFRQLTEGVDFGTARHGGNGTVRGRNAK